MIKPRETFLFNPPIQIKEDWMLGLTSLELYNSIFNITEGKDKFKLYKVSDEKSGGVSYGKIRDEVEKHLDILDFTATTLEDDLICPIIREYREQLTKRMKKVGYMKILAIFIRSLFQDFESYLRTELLLVEDVIRFVLDEKIQVLSLLNYNQVFTLLKIFQNSFLISFNLNIQDLVT